MNYYKRTYNFIARDLWHTTGRQMGRWRKLAYATLKTLVLTIRGYNDNNIGMRSNSLTYSFMFAIVPILAMIVGFARGFDFGSIIEDYLNRSILGDYNLTETVMGFVDRYLETAHGGAFMGIGLFVLLWAIYSFFRNVESSFNAIWQVRKSRSLMRQFTAYITILLAIPVLLIASSGIGIFLHGFHSDHDFPCMHRFLLNVIPWATTWIVFFIMYLTVPNTHVKWQAALIPGILIGSIVVLLQKMSVYIVMFLGRTSVVYGTFAAIPLLLTWVQWTCLAILFGAELSYSIQNNEHFDFEQETESMSRRYKDYLTLYICHQIVSRFEQGKDAYAATDLAHMDKLPARVVNNLLSRLVETKILTEIRPEKDTDPIRYQPALDINKMTVGYVLSHIEQQGEEGFFNDVAEDMQIFWGKWTDIRKEDAAFNSMLVKDL